MKLTGEDSIENVRGMKTKCSKSFLTNSLNTLPWLQPAFPAKMQNSGGGGVIIGSFSNGDGSENVPIKEFASLFFQTLLRLL